MPGHALQRIIERLRRQAPRGGVGVVCLIVFIPTIRRDGKLIGARLANRPHQLADVEVGGDEVLGQAIQQFRIARQLSRMAKGKARDTVESKVALLTAREQEIVAVIARNNGEPSKAIARTPWSRN